MPWCRDNTPTQTLLGTLTRGVILQEDDGDIYATRLCQCAVFFGDKRGVLTKLERLELAMSCSRLAQGLFYVYCYCLLFIRL